MNLEEAAKMFKSMTYEQAIHNCLNAKCVPYRQAMKMKVAELLQYAKILDKDDNKNSTRN